MSKLPNDENKSVGAGGVTNNPLPSLAAALSADKIGKIRSDLEIVRNNMTVFSEMLTELNPSGGGNPSDLELLQELYKTCKEMQTRVGQLLCTPTTDELTVDMLQINDDLNDLFDRYDRKTAGYKLNPVAGEEPLIDFDLLGEELGAGATPSLIQDLGAMNIHPKKKDQENKSPIKKEDADFDQFVSSRSSNPNEKKSNMTPRPFVLSEQEEIMQGHRETDFEEMEAWLKANPGSEASLAPIPAPMESYLNHRAEDSNQRNKN